MADWFAGLGAAAAVVVSVVALVLSRRDVGRARDDAAAAQADAATAQATAQRATAAQERMAAELARANDLASPAVDLQVERMTSGGSILKLRIANRGGATAHGVTVHLAAGDKPDRGALPAGVDVGPDGATESFTFFRTSQDANAFEDLLVSCDEWGEARSLAV